MNELPGDALVRAYANGGEVAQLLASLPTQLAPRTSFEWAAAALTSEQGGLRVQAYVQRASGTPAEVTPYRSTLVDEIPSGVLGVVDFDVPSGFSPPKLFGANASQLAALLGGETAIYVRPGMPIPEVTLVSHPADAAAAAQALDSLLAAIPAGSPLHALKLVHATVGGAFVVSTSQAGIDGFGGGGARLSNDPSFQQAEKQAGVPQETTGFVYANVKDALPLLQLAGVKLPQDLPNLGTVFAYGARTNGQSTVSAFVGVG
jgi:hypothetical protein